MTRLFHYCCQHSARKIGAAGDLIPWPQPIFHGAEFLWLTDDPRPTRVGLGLTSHVLTCDRTNCRYVIDDPAADIHAIPWVELRDSVPADHVQYLEQPGTRPHTWLLSDVPLFARRDRHWHGIH